MIEIEDIPTVGLGEPVYWVKMFDLSANIFDDGKFFCAKSFDSEWCCIGVVINTFDNLNDDNPILQVNNVYHLR